MHHELNNVLQLKAFYDSPAGHKFCQKIRKAITGKWQNISKEKIAGFGFAAAHMPIFAADNQVISLMPATIGAVNLHTNIATALVDETALPLRNEVLDKIFTIHALENSADLPTMFFEFWRVLKPYGKILLVFDDKKTDCKKVAAILSATKFNITSAKPLSLLSKIYVIEAQKLIFAQRGRPQKVTKSILDKLTKPKPKLAT